VAGRAGELAGRRHGRIKEQFPAEIRDRLVGSQYLGATHQEKESQSLPTDRCHHAAAIVGFPCNLIA
jgi:hypothetical protein